MEHAQSCTLCKCELLYVKIGKRRVVVMKRKRREEIFDLCHKGHTGVRNTFEKMKRTFYWKALFKYVEEKVLMGLLFMVIDCQIKYNIKIL